MEPISDADLGLLLLIRHLELALLRLFAAGQVGGTVHTCLGQEHVPVALAPLVAGGMVFSNHRGHGHYLAHTGDPQGLLAEILGREGAPCHGVGGSQHLRSGGFRSTGVQGQNLPVAVGAALHAARNSADGLATVYIGDGTFGEGAVYEALNLAALWQVPLLVVAENNGIAQSTPVERAMAGTVAGRAAAFGIDFHHVAHVDVTRIRKELAPRIARARTQRHPLLVEFDAVRLGPHSKGDDTRGAEELTALRARDWHTHYAAALGERFTAAERQQQQRIADLVGEILRRPLATWEPA
jgi:TPP-dependent pyruvate/acetoin dehydrogenase alpha subunit